MISGENIDGLLSYAKLPPSDFYKVIQTIKFSEEFNNENYSIFIVNKEILKSLEESDNFEELSKLYIKGKEDQSAVLCTDKNTFELSEAETSNTLLIVPQLKVDLMTNSMKDENFIVREVDVLASCNKVFGLKEIRAKSGEVYKILESTVLRHHIEDDKVGQVTYSFLSLLEQVSMSKHELEKILEQLKVYLYNDKLRLLHADYVSEIISRIIDSALETDSDVHSISQYSVHSLLDSLYPPNILDQTLKFYFKPVCEHDGDTTWEINDAEISKCFAEQILCNYSQITVNDFVAKWRKKLPEEISVSMSCLSGMVLVNDTVTPSTIKLFKTVFLPDDPESRFKELFAQRSHWSQEDLESFVHDIVPKNETASQMLVRYCRCSNSGKGKIFSKR